MNAQIINCNGNNCTATLEVVSKPSESEWARKDSYGYFTGLYCHNCYEKNYPYRKDAYFDPSYAGETL